MVGLPLITNGCVVLFSGKLPGADADVFNPSQIKLQQKKKGNGGKNQPWSGKKFDQLVVDTSLLNPN